MSLLLQSQISSELVPLGRNTILLLFLGCGCVRLSVLLPTYGLKILCTLE